MAGQPLISFNFAETKTLGSLVTFSRASSATYFDSNGILKIASSDVARFDHAPVSKTSRGLLIEEQRSNLYTYSEQFENAIWGKDGTSISSNSVVAPDGNTTGDKLIENNSNAFHGIAPAGVAGLNGSYVFSYYVRAAGRSWIYAGCYNATSKHALIDIENMVVSTLTNATANISDIGNNWRRITISVTLTNAEATFPYIYMTTSGTAGFVAYQGDGTSGIDLWGAQLEAGAFVTSYIPTTSTAVTRSADVATITGANFSSWWVASQGGVSANFRPSTVSGTRPIIQYDDGTANEIITLRGNTTNPELYIVDGGTPQAQIDAGTIAANTDYRLTGWWATNDCKAKLDSGAIVTDTTATIPTVTQARIGSDGTNYLNGTIASLNYYGSFTGQIYTRRKNKVIFSLM